MCLLATCDFVDLCSMFASCARKVQYLDGGYKRFTASELCQLIAKRPKNSQSLQDSFDGAVDSTYLKPYFKLSKAAV